VSTAVSEIISDLKTIIRDVNTNASVLTDAEYLTLLKRNSSKVWHDIVRHTKNFPQLPQEITLINNTYSYTVTAFSSISDVRLKVTNVPFRFLKDLPDTVRDSTITGVEGVLYAGERYYSYTNDTTLWIYPTAGGSTVRILYTPKHPSFSAVTDTVDWRDSWIDALIFSTARLYYTIQNSDYQAKNYLKLYNEALETVAQEVINAVDDIENFRMQAPLG
jgi:hypothetical protein